MSTPDMPTSPPSDEDEWEEIMSAQEKIEIDCAKAMSLSESEEKRCQCEPVAEPAAEPAEDCAADLPGIQPPPPPGPPPMPATVRLDASHSAEPATTGGVASLGAAAAPDQAKAKAIAKLPLWLQPPPMSAEELRQDELSREMEQGLMPAPPLPGWPEPLINCAHRFGPPCANCRGFYFPPHDLPPSGERYYLFTRAQQCPTHTPPYIVVGHFVAQEFLGGSWRGRGPIHSFPMPKAFVRLEDAMNAAANHNRVAAGWDGCQSDHVRVYHQYRAATVVEPVSDQYQYIG